MTTKNYLVACYDNNEKIFMMQEMMLFINMDPETRGKFLASVKRSELFSEKINIKFSNQTEIDKLDGSFYFGMTMGERYSSLACKEKYNRIYDRSIRMFGKNDRDCFLTKLVKKIKEEGRKDVYQKLDKQTKQ